MCNLVKFLRKRIGDIYYEEADDKARGENAYE